MPVRSCPCGARARRRAFVYNVRARERCFEQVKHLVDEEERFRYAIRPNESLDGEASTPLRDASFDLLKNAVTSEALRALLAECDATPVSLQEAYTKRRRLDSLDGA